MPYALFYLNMLLVLFLWRTQTDRDFGTGSGSTGTKWHHSTAKGKVDVVVMVDSRVKAAMKIVWLMQTYSID